METIVQDDGSKIYLYERGDYVRVVRPKREFNIFPFTKVGDWGRVYHVEQPKSCITALCVQLSNGTIKIPCWDVEPCNDKGESIS